MNPKPPYELVLRLYPRDYRVMFSAEMVNAFEAAAQERREHGTAAFVRFALAELFGLAIGSVAEWVAKLTADRSTRGRCLPDWQIMRPLGVTREQWFRRNRCSSDTSQ